MLARLSIDLRIETSVSMSVSMFRKSKTVLSSYIKLYILAVIKSPIKVVYTPELNYPPYNGGYIFVIIMKNQGFFKFIIF